MVVRWQVSLAVFAWLLTAAVAWADSRQQLETESRQLLRMAVVRPYGVAYADPAADTAGLPRGAEIVSFQARSTPAAGWIIARAARLTGNRELDDTAKKIARGIAAAQESSGRIPSQAIFGGTISPKRPPGGMFDRSATTACLGFLLAYTSDHPEDEVSRRCAMRAAQWLLHEQTPSGAWITQLEDPDQKMFRAIRLDTADFRDAVFALSMGFDVLKEPGLRRGAGKAAELLLRTRIETSKTAGGLWRAICYLDGSPCDLFDDQGGVDCLASRYAMQALACVTISQSSVAADDGFRRAAVAISKLKYEDDLWRRVYLVGNNNEVTEMPRGAAPQRETAFATQKPDPDSIDQQTGTFGLPALLRLGNSIAPPGPGQIGDDLALTLIGLSDRPFTFPRPTTAAQAVSALEKGQHLWEIIDGPAPDGLPERLGRLSVLIYKLQLEKLADAPTTRPVADK